MVSSDQILEVPTDDSKEAKVQRYTKMFRDNKQFEDVVGKPVFDPKAGEKARQVLQKLESGE